MWNGEKKSKYAKRVRVSLETSEKGLIALNVKNNKKNFQRENATAYASRANESTLENIIRYLPAWGFPEGVEQ